MRTRTQQAREWRARVADAGAWPGSLESYCRSAGVSAPALRYWKKKLANERRSDFVQVEVVAERAAPARELPDPRWLAELIGHLYGVAR